MTIIRIITIVLHFFPHFSCIYVYQGSALFIGTISFSESLRKIDQKNMGGNVTQSITLITIFIGISSTVLSKFLQVVLSSRGLMNRWDIFVLALVSWFVFFALFRFLIDVLDIFESKRPYWLYFLINVGTITNIVIGVFLSFYLGSLIETVNFQAFGFAEVIIIMVAGIFFLAVAQLVFERYTILGDTRASNNATIDTKR